MEFSVFLADVRPSSSSKKLSLGAAQTYSGFEEAGVHHIEENPTRFINSECFGMTRTRLRWAWQTTDPLRLIQIWQKHSFTTGT